MAMKDPMQPKKCAELLGALAAPERLRIVRVLREGPKSVGEIAGLIDASLVNVSHHLSVLRHAGLVRNKKKGRFVVYSIAPGVLDSEAKSSTDHLDLGCCRLEIPKE
ncbi:MAG: winged helix-turn-helix transcriptional regulator [Planctomycetes bacterium]|nr:winged helix-turn-helix transcriptional regulator [Planctomycetota bacterium]